MGGICPGLWLQTARLSIQLQCKPQTPRFKCQQRVRIREASDPTAESATAVLPLPATSLAVLRMLAAITMPATFLATLPPMPLAAAAFPLAATVAPMHVLVVNVVALPFMLIVLKTAVVAMLMLPTAALLTVALLAAVLLTAMLIMAVLNRAVLLMAMAVLITAVAVAVLTPAALITAALVTAVLPRPTLTAALPMALFPIHKPLFPILAATFPSAAPRRLSTAPRPITSTPELAVLLFRNITCCTPQQSRMGRVRMLCRWTVQPLNQRCNGRCHTATVQPGLLRSVLLLLLLRWRWRCLGTARICALRRDAVRVGRVLLCFYQRSPQLLPAWEESMARELEV